MQLHTYGTNKEVCGEPPCAYWLMLHAQEQGNTVDPARGYPCGW